MKREEIREGVRQRYLARWSSAIEPDMVDRMLQDAEGFTDGILKYLHPQGCVITSTHQDWTDAGNEYRRRIVEPLIEE